MRKLMWFTIGFAAACAAGIYLGVGLWLAPVCAALGIAFFFFKRKITAVIAAVCIGLAIGGIGYFLHSFFLADLFADTEEISVPNFVGKYADTIDYSAYPDFDIYISAY